jgi:hypothetical protein
MHTRSLGVEAQAPARIIDQPHLVEVRDPERIRAESDRYDRTAAAQLSSTGPRTIEIGAAIATAQDGHILSGPMREKIPLARKAAIEVWAAPDATVRIYNASVLENGAPKLLWTGQAPADANAPASPRSKPLGPASPSDRGEWARMRERFSDARVPGQTLLAAELAAELDWTVHDTLLVTQQSGRRAESEPESFHIQHYIRTAEPRVRDPYFVASRLDRDGRNITGETYSVPPNATLTVLRDGVPTDEHFRADARGAFSLELPADWNHATWELGVATPGGSAIAPLNGSTAAGSGMVLDGIMRNFRQGLMQVPRNGKIKFQLSDLPPGLEIRIYNSAKSSSPASFTVDQSGRVLVSLDQVQSGDRLALETTQIAELKGSEKHAKSLALTFQVPTRKEADRIARMEKQLRGYSEADTQLALSLFGPFASIAVLPATLKTAPALRAAVDAAKLGAFVAKHQRAWLPELEDHLRRHAAPSVREAFLAGAGFRGEVSLPAAGLEQHGFTLKREGVSERVGTRIKPPETPPPGILWSYPRPVPRLQNRPMDAETIRTPDLYTFSWPNLPPIVLETGEIKPVGDIDRNIIIFTIGMATRDA